MDNALTSQQAAQMRMHLVGLLAMAAEFRLRRVLRLLLT